MIQYKVITEIRFFLWTVNRRKKRKTKDNVALCAHGKFYFLCVFYSYDIDQYTLLTVQYKIIIYIFLLTEISYLTWVGVSSGLKRHVVSSIIG